MKWIWKMKLKYAQSHAQAEKMYDSIHRGSYFSFAQKAAKKIYNAKDGSISNLQKLRCFWRIIFLLSRKSLLSLSSDCQIKEEFLLIVLLFNQETVKDREGLGSFISFEISVFLESKFLAFAYPFLNILPLPVTSRERVLEPIWRQVVKKIIL